MEGGRRKIEWRAMGREIRGRARASEGVKGGDRDVPWQAQQ